MSTQLVRTKVRELLSNGTAEVIALNGRWGVGKTFFWTRLIEAGARDKTLAHKKYAYVSLFGIANIDQLKSAIFEQTVQVSHIAEGVTVRSVVSNVREFLGAWGEDDNAATSRMMELGQLFARKSAAIATRIPQIQGYVGLLRSGVFHMVRDTLICIDDLERKGAGLEVRDVMGLISFLKEQRDCKVALIFNEGSLSGEPGRQYSEYREKVVDVELEFAPSVREVVSLVFDEKLPHFSTILTSAERLQLTNIRILQKVKRTLADLAPILQSLLAETTENALTAIILLSWAYFSRETGGPTLAYIESLDAGYTWAMDEKKKKSGLDFDARPMTEVEQKRIAEEERISKWNTVLRAYGWQYTDDLDRLIARHIQRGYPSDELHAELRKKDEANRGGKAQQAFEQAWKRFHESFDDNADELVSGLDKTVRANVRHIGRDQLNGVVSLLRTLGEDQKADSLSDLFVEANMDRPDMFQPDVLLPGQTIDPYLADKFLRARGLTEKAPQIQDVVHRIATNESWNETDEEFLAGLTPDDIYTFLKAQHSMSLHPYIRALLRFGQFGNSTERQKKIADNTMTTLKRIAGESRLNEVRLRRYQPGT